MFDYHLLYYYLFNESKECKMQKKNETRKMNKEIEEMMLTVPQKIVAYDGNPAGQHLYGEQRQEIAEALYNAGYRKIDEFAECRNCIAWSGTDCTRHPYTQGCLKDENNIKRQAVNEFAKKVKNKLFEFFQDNEGLDGKISVGVLYVDIIGVEAKDGTIISLGLIDELLKEYEK